MYKKRLSSVNHPHYGTKLTSLIIFRLLHESDVTEFDLSSRIENIGTFNDICFKYKVKDYEQPTAVFLQCKHRVDEATCLKFDVKDLVSCLEIIRKMNKSDDDKIFNTSDDTDYVFVLYTDSKYNEDLGLEAITLNNAPKLNKLIATGKGNPKSIYNDKQIKKLNKAIAKEEISILVERFAKFLIDKPNQSMNIMMDDYILQYHAFLANNVVEVSKIETDGTTEWRKLKFQSDFFYTDDYIVTLFRDKLNKLVLNNQSKIKKNYRKKIKPLVPSQELELSVEELIAAFVSEQSAKTLSRLIGTIVKYKNGKLEFKEDKPCKEHIQALESINISPLTVSKAQAMASARNTLASLELTVPSTFGNVDIKIRGNKTKIGKRIDFLAKTIVDLCQNFKAVEGFKIVDIDSVAEGFLSVNGGIGSAVSNLLVYDKVTKLLMITENFSLLKDNARSLFDKLNTQLENIHSYRFNVKVMNFPKLVFDFADESKLILSKLIIFEKQSNHHGIEAILKNQIDNHQKSHTAYNLRTTPEKIFQNFHSEVIMWHIAPKAKYITKTSDIYQHAIKSILFESQLSLSQNSFYKNKIKNIKHTAEALKSLELMKRKNEKDGESIIILTEVPTLAATKVIQYLGKDLSENYTILDLEHLFELPVEDLRAFEEELTVTENVLILVCDNILYFDKYTKLIETVKDKNKIIITNNTFAKTAKILMPDMPQQVIYEKHRLTNLTAESQKHILKNSQVVFQGYDVNLDYLIDETSIDYIKGLVLDKIIHNETIVIGESLSNANYDKLKHLYIDRRVTYKATYLLNRNIHKDVTKIVRSINDIDDDLVLVTGKSGMGKSVLLTHVAIKTKKLNKKLWIIRLNLLDYTRQLSKWQKSTKVIDILEVLSFICQYLLNQNFSDATDLNICLEEAEDRIFLKKCTGNELASFTLNLFLHYYHIGNVVFLFDGFDEICPHYPDVIDSIINAINRDMRFKKVWITSRMCGAVRKVLKPYFSARWEINDFSVRELNTFLDKFWETNLNWSEFNDDVIKRIKYLLNETSSGDVTSAVLSRPLCRVYVSLIWYLITNYEQLNDENLRESLYSTIVSLSQSNDEGGMRAVTVDHIHEVETPLVTYLSADYFVNRIHRVDEYTNSITADVDVSTIYKEHIDTITRKRFQNIKNKIQHKKACGEFIDNHKKIAGYIIFRHQIYDMIDQREVADIVSIINNIDLNAEKNALIINISNKIPQFKHYTFAEYLAVEYLFDLMSLLNEDRRQILINMLFNELDLLSVWIQEKIRKDKYNEFANYFSGLNIKEVPFPNRSLNERPQTNPNGRSRNKMLTCCNVM